MLNETHGKVKLVIRFVHFRSQTTQTSDKNIDMIIAKILVELTKNAEALYFLSNKLIGSLLVAEAVPSKSIYSKIFLHQ